MTTLGQRKANNNHNINRMIKIRISPNRVQWAPLTKWVADNVINFLKTVWQYFSQPPKVIPSSGTYCNTLKKAF